MGKKHCRYRPLLRQFPPPALSKPDLVFVDSFFHLNHTCMKRNVLLIDNDPAEVKTFMEAVKNMEGSFTCSHVPDVKQAWVLLREEKPHIVFAKDSLPGLNGFHLLSGIKNDRRLKRTKVFIYTNLISDEIDKMARLLGASGCMEKKDDINWLTHQFKAIFAGDLMPEYTLLKAS
jgi:DNA-binding NarL/FixJ family response regulator